MDDRRIEQAAQVLASAWRANHTVDFPPDLLPQDRQEAYAVQDRMASLVDDRISGWKVGATSPGVQAAEGYDGPIPGRIFAATLYQRPARIAAAVCQHAKVEAEIGFQLVADLDARHAPFSPETLRAAVVLLPAFDITATRYRPDTRTGWNPQQNMLAGIADNGNGGAVVVGQPVDDWQHFDLMALAVDVRINRGPAAPNLFGSSRGHPFDALVWTVNSVFARGFTMQTGDYVLTGSLISPQSVGAGDRMRALFPGLGELAAEIV